MFINKLQTIFIFVLIISIALIFYNLYQDYIFKNNKLPINIINKVNNKKQKIIQKIYNKYNIYFDVKILYSNKMPNKLYGLAQYYNKKITIFLNKKRFQENTKYMIDDVLPHEYAHALMFKLGFLNEKNQGHSKRWQQVCKNIDAIKCNQYVNIKDIIFDKL
jgi:predicted SprT family Zn-dependent metalloprotease